jgi:catechol 2,3-dioxygenase-like lactoylglutathione lyase family enzyme
MSLVRAIDRRVFLSSLPALAFVPRLSAGMASAVGSQAQTAPIRVTGLSQMTLTVADVKRSVEFYQALFGMPVQARHGSTVLLRVGQGPQFVAIKAAAAGERPSISAFGMGVEGFNADRLLKTLIDRGATAVQTADGALAPMQVRLNMRSPASGSPEGAPEIFVGDPSGINFQLHDVSYCGGSGPLGNACRTEPAPGKGLLAVRDMSHFTINVGDAAKTLAFYQGLFGLTVQVSQGATPAYGVGPGVHFLMFIGGGGRGPAPAAARIDHACLGMDAFDPDGVTKTLVKFGIKPQPNAGRTPLITYITMRMPNRGGADGGTPELYFTDPDGLAIQLQDVKYCGGGGFLGDICP